MSVDKLRMHRAMFAPEEQIRKRIEQAERTVERKEWAALEGFVSDAYADEQGRDKHTVVQLLTQHLLRQGSVHLLTKTAEIRLLEFGSAQVDLLVAAAATPVEGLDDLSRIQADLYRFDLTFQQENGAWQLTTAQWRTAALGEFL
jgi:hypothetical protein